MKKNKDIEIKEFWYNKNNILGARNLEEGFDTIDKILLGLKSKPLNERLSLFSNLMFLSNLDNFAYKKMLDEFLQKADLTFEEFRDYVEEQLKLNNKIINKKFEWFKKLGK